jgi:hypothetical protein
LHLLQQVPQVLDIHHPSPFQASVCGNPTRCPHPLP